MKLDEYLTAVRETEQRTERAEGESPCAQQLAGLEKPEGVWRSYYIISA